MAKSSLGIILAAALATGAVGCGKLAEKTAEAIAGPPRAVYRAEFTPHPFRLEWEVTNPPDGKAYLVESCAQTTPDAEGTCMVFFKLRCDHGDGKDDSTCHVVDKGIPFDWDYRHRSEGLRRIIRLKPQVEDEETGYAQMSDAFKEKHLYFRVRVESDDEVGDWTIFSVLSGQN